MATLVACYWPASLETMANSSRLGLHHARAWMPPSADAAIMNALMRTPLPGHYSKLLVPSQSTEAGKQRESTPNTVKRNTYNDVHYFYLNVDARGLLHIFISLS